MTSNILITGAAGFLGSALTLGAQKEYKVFALDSRLPSPKLTHETPGTSWIQADIRDPAAMKSVFNQITSEFGPIKFVVHLAAYYHFGTDWRREYDDTNVRGTENLLNLASDFGVQRFIFGSSVLASEPQQPFIDEDTPASEYIPYAKSKKLGENLVRTASSKVPGLTVRIAGAFSDWCEVPPLYALIHTWSKFWGRAIPGHGHSGSPYIHIQDVISLFMRVMKIHEKLESYDQLLASPNGFNSHMDLFQAIRKILYLGGKSVFIPGWMLGLGLQARRCLFSPFDKRFFEQPWMVRYLEQPWNVNSNRTQERCGWSCDPNFLLVNRLPKILQNYQQNPSKWRKKFQNRMNGNFESL